MTRQRDGLRKRKGHRVSVPSETIRDKRLSWKARGMLVFLLDQPEGWDVRAAWLAEQGPDGRDAATSGLKELRRYGYHRLERRRALDGTFHMGTSISEEPVPEWAADSNEYDDKPVPCIEQPDGSYKVLHPDGTLTDDGFGPESTGFTQNGFPVTGQPVPGSPAPGSPVAESSKTRGSNYTEDVIPPLPPAAAGGDEVLDAELVDDDEPVVLVEVPTGPVPGFDDFWAVYPRKDDKGRARRAWDTAVKRKKIPPQLIIEGARRFAADPNLPPPAEARFIKQPATWLNAEAWGNGPLPPRGSGNRRQDAREAMFAEWDIRFGQDDPPGPSNGTGPPEPELVVDDEWWRQP
jgi:hypothetical protein